MSEQTTLHEALQEQGYRLTAARQVILQVLASSGGHVTADDLVALVREEEPGIGRMTVYRTLDKLEELGLIQRVHQPGGCNMYLWATHGHEHLLLCTNCGRVDTFRGDDLTGLIAETARGSGFKIQEHWLQLFGLCSACQA